MPQESTFKPVTEAVKQAVKDVGSQIQGLGSDITGKFRQTFDEEMEEIVSWGESVFGRVKQIFGPFLSSIGQWFLQTKLLKSTAGFLKKMLSIEEWRKKRERMEQGFKKKSLLMDILRGLGMFFGLAAGAGAAILGAILAPILGPIIKPLEILGKAFMAFKTRVIGIVKWIRQFSKDPFGLGSFRMSKAGPLKKIFDFFSSIRKLIPPKVLSMAKTGFSWISKIFKWIIGIGTKIMSLGGGKLFGILMKSLNRVFWPLQIIVSVIDFVKGFMATEGDIVDKIYGGINNVLKEFFGYPIALLGKLVDWVAEKFGIENLGAEEFLTDGFNKLVDVFTSIPIFFKDLIKGWIIDAIDVIRDSDITGIFQPIFDFFEKMKDKIITGIYKYIQNSPLLQKILNFAGGADFLKNLETQVNDIQNREREMTEYEKQRLEQEKQKLDIAKRQTSGGNTLLVQSNDNSTNAGTPPADTGSSRWVNSGAEADLSSL